jgi:hypothetical protein
MAPPRLTLPDRVSTLFRRRQELQKPPTMEAPKRFPYGPFRFQAHLVKGTNFRVQASRDLKIWNDIGQGIVEKQGLEYVDSEAFKYNHRFYRLFANGIRSENVLGYASTTVPPGYSMIANPFTGSDGGVADLLPGWPDGTSLSRFDTNSFKLNENKVDHGKWTVPGERLAPGEGAIFFNPTNDYKLISFAGEINMGDVSLPVPAGFSIRSAPGPYFGDVLKGLEFPIGEGDVVHLFDRDRQTYVIYPYEGGKWQGEAPVVSLCEAFWVAKTKAANWRAKIKIEE